MQFKDILATVSQCRIPLADTPRAEVATELLTAGGLVVGSSTLNRGACGFIGVFHLGGCPLIVHSHARHTSPPPGIQVIILSSLLTFRKTLLASWRWKGVVPECHDFPSSPFSHPIQPILRPSFLLQGSCPRWLIPFITSLRVVFFLDHSFFPISYFFLVLSFIFFNPGSWFSTHAMHDSGPQGAPPPQPDWRRPRELWLGRRRQQGPRTVP